MKNYLFLFTLAVLFLVATAIPAAAQNYPFAALRFLDKVTTQRNIIAAPVGKTVAVGSLQILARSCTVTEGEQKPESAAFVEIYDTKDPSGVKKPVFSGWLFKSSSSLSAVEHPIYDVMMLDCKNSANIDP